MYNSFVDCVLISISLWQLVKCQGQLHTQLRLTKAVNCEMPGLKWFMRNISVHYDYPKTYLNARFDIIETIKELKKYYLHIERCNDQGYDCEDFQNWRVDRFCRMLIWKNQVWSVIIESIHPTIRCPIKKMTYELRNATMDIEAVMNWFPNIAKYRWKTTNKIIDEKDAVVQCGYFEWNFHQYFTRESKKPSKRPRNR